METQVDGVLESVVDEVLVKENRNGSAESVGGRDRRRLDRIDVATRDQATTQRALEVVDRGDAGPTVEQVLHYEHIHSTSIATHSVLEADVEETHNASQETETLRQ